MKDHTGSLMDKRQLLECGLQSSTNIVPARAGEKKNKRRKKGKEKWGGKKKKNKKNGKQRGRKGTKKNKSAEAADSRPEM